MSAKPLDTGKNILVAHLTAVEGKEQDLANILKNIAKHSNSEAEPGCLTYRVTQHGNKFVVFEEYVDATAVDAHFKTDLFKVLQSAIQKKDVENLDIKYYQEI